MAKSSSSDTRLTIHSTALVAQDTDLRGEVTIGANCIIHPRATIIAAVGPIILGEGCVVEETAVIVNRGPEVMRIGKANVFMVGCRIESPSIGDNNTFRARCKVSSLIAVSDHCTLGANTITLPANPASTAVETLLARTVVYGELSERRIWDGSGEVLERVTREKEMEYLREIMPK